MQKTNAKGAKCRTSSEQAEGAIRAKIIAGKFVPGQRLVEIDLMEELDVSRGMIRAIFRKLESEGILEITKNRGASVKKLSRQEFNDTVEVLHEITCLATRLVAKRFREPEIQRALKKSLDIARAFENDMDKHGLVQDYMLENVRFWGCIGNLSGNSVLQKQRERLQLPLLRLQTQGLILNSAQPKWIVKHLELIEALLNGEARSANSLAIQAQKGVWQAMQELPDSAFS